MLIEGRVRKGMTNSDPGPNNQRPEPPKGQQVNNKIIDKVIPEMELARLAGYLTRKFNDEIIRKVEKVEMTVDMAIRLLNRLSYLQNRRDDITSYKVRKEENNG